MSKLDEAIKRQILVVDDQEINRDLLGMILEDDYFIYYAENGREALRMMPGLPVSAVLLDLNMPVMNGYQVIEEMKKDEELSHIPIIVLTAEKNAELETLHLGAVSFITKPFEDPEIIRARVNNLVELSEDRKLIEATEKDDLTGLYRENFFFEYALQMKRYHPEWKMDALVLDIDRFRLVNEMYGRHFGDIVLQKVGAEILSAFSGGGGIGGRTGSDIFYIFCRHEEDYEERVEKLTEALNSLRENLRIHLHLGVCSMETDLHRMFDWAKDACGLLKGNYARSVSYYDSAIHEKELFQESLMNDLQRALDEKEFLVYYQPKYDVTGEKPFLRAAEALIRWKHPKYGMVPPGMFIPLFEKSGLVHLVDQYVWKETARQLKEWKDRFGRTIPVSVNLSRVDIHEPGLVDNLLSLVSDNGLDADLLHIEITESAYTDDEDQLAKVTEELRSDGFLIEMDDFGAGYSSLNMLSILPLDVLKMDMKFVRDLKDASSKNYKMVKIVSDIARSLGVPLVAEGVETEEQLRLLQLAGCTMIQGYYFSRPVPAEEFEKFILAEMGEKT